MSQPSVFEFLADPKILCNRHYTSENLSFNGVKLGDDASFIPNSSIRDTRMEQMPENVTHTYISDAGTFYKIEGVEIEYKLSERIQSVKKKGGRLFTNFNLGYGIKNGKIVEILILEDGLTTFEQIGRSNIVNEFGKWDIEDEDYDYQHGALMNTHFYFTAKKMTLIFDEWDKKLSMIRFGEELEWQS